MYDENSLNGLGVNIKMFRTVNHISQGELAKQLGISQTHMSNIEHGRVLVNLRLLMRIANIFKCKLDDFFAPPGAAASTAEPPPQEQHYSAEDIGILLQIVQATKKTVRQQGFAPQFTSKAKTKATSKNKGSEREMEDE